MTSEHNQNELQIKTMNKSNSNLLTNTSFEAEFHSILGSSDDLKIQRGNSSQTKIERPRPVCKLCSKSFSKPANLKAHTRIHTGEQRYSCNFCNKRFTWKSSLNFHNKQAQKGGRYRCKGRAAWKAEQESSTTLPSQNDMVYPLHLPTTVEASNPEPAVSTPKSEVSMVSLMMVEENDILPLEAAKPEYEPEAFDKFSNFFSQERDFASYGLLNDDLNRIEDLGKEFIMPQDVKTWFDSFAEFEVSPPDEESMTRES